MDRNFDIVIYTGDDDVETNMEILTSDIPKALIPIGNKPTIAYFLEMVEEQKFSNVLLLVDKSHFKKVHSYITTKFKSKLKIEVFQIEEGISCWRALEDCKSKIKKDFLLINLDNLCQLSLNELIDYHTLNNNILTMALYELKDPKDQGDLVLFEESTNRILHYTTKSDLQDLNEKEKTLGLPVKTKLLQHFPIACAKPNIIKCGIYAFSNKVLELFSNENRNQHTDLISHLVKHQANKKLIKKLTGTAHATQISKLEELHKKKEPETLSIRAFFCKRYLREIIQINQYLQANMDCLIPLAAQPLLLKPTENNPKPDVIVKDCLIGPGTILKGTVNSSRCIIGSKCEIGDKCVLKNCVILSGTQIDAGCTITGTVIGENCRIGGGNKITDCKIANNFTIEPATKSTKEYKDKTLKAEHEYIFEQK